MDSQPRHPKTRPLAMASFILAGIVLVVAVVLSVYVVLEVRADENSLAPLWFLYVVAWTVPTLVGAGLALIGVRTGRRSAGLVLAVLGAGINLFVVLSILAVFPPTALI